MNRLSCLSPLPDQRRDSSGEDFFFNLPVPKQFADNGSRRSSGVQPERIPELEENSVSLEKELPRGNTLLVPEIKDIERSTFEQRPPFISNYPNDETPPRQERFPQVVIESSNIYVGDTMNIIDTDQPVSYLQDAATTRSYVQPPLLIFFQERTSSDELASDILSAISNEECSVGSEILDKPLECDPQDFVAASIQVVFCPQSAPRNPPSFVLFSRHRISNRTRLDTSTVQRRAMHCTERA